MRIDGWMGLMCGAAAALAASALIACAADVPVATGAPRAVPSKATTAAPRQPVASPAAPAATSPAAATCGLPDFQASALARINRARAAGADCHSAGRFAPARPLSWNDRLAQAATMHSRDMSRHDFFSHTGSDGRNVSQRASAVAYPWTSIGENIEAGYSSVNEAVEGWMQSDHHCANIMEPGFNEMALACVNGGPDNGYTSYWTLDLGRRR